MSEILDLLRRRLVFVVACGLIAAGVPAALATTSPDSYRATARLFVATAAQDVTAANQGNLAAQSRVRSYALLAVGPELLTRAAQRSGVAISEESLARRISVSTPPDTVLLDIAATAGSPQEAAALSDAVSQELVTLVSQAERPLRGGSPSLGLLILQPADAGIAKVPAIVPTQLALFGVAGLVLGVVIAILVPGRFRLRRRNRADTASPQTTATAQTTSMSETTPTSDTGASDTAASDRAEDSPESPRAETGRPAPETVTHIADPSTSDAAPAHPAPQRSRVAPDHHPNWTTFDTLDTGRRPVGAPQTNGDRPAQTNGHRPSSAPASHPPHASAQDRPVERPAWAELTDPTGSFRPISNGVEPSAPRRHRRESGAWQFSPTQLTDDDARRADRSR